jgi:putative flippase GtrA
MRLGSPQHHLSAQAGRYLLVGGLAWVVDFLSFSLSVSVLGLAWAQTLARIMGAVVGFLGHKYLVFADRRRGGQRLLRQGWQYLILWLLSYGLSLAGLFWLVVGLRLHPIVAKLLVESVVVLINFAVMKRVIFNGG